LFCGLLFFHWVLVVWVAVVLRFSSLGVCHGAPSNKDYSCVPEGGQVHREECCASTDGVPKSFWGAFNMVEWGDCIQTEDTTEVLGQISFTSCPEKKVEDGSVTFARPRGGGGGKKKTPRTGGVWSSFVLNRGSPLGDTGG